MVSKMKGQLSNRAILVGVLVVIGVISGTVLFSLNHTTVHEHNETIVVHTAVAKIEKISVWQFGKEDAIEQNREECTKLANNLISIIEKASLQGTCAIFRENVERLKQEGRIIELTFREPINVTISQWIKPEDRNHIPTNAGGYRILTNIEKVIFVLEGKYEGHILTKSADKMGYGCWAIYNGEIDKSWIDEIENVIRSSSDNIQKIVEISRQHPTVKKYLEMHPNATYDVRRVYFTSMG